MPDTDSSPDGRSSQPIYAIYLVVALAATIRLLGITRPLLGNFATKNVVHAMIARNWALGRCGLLYPALDCLANGRRSLHMLEFSLSAYLTGAVWKLCGGSLELWGRLTSVLFSVASVGLMYCFVRGRHGTVAAVGAAAMLAFSPVSIIYGQSFMLDASLVFFTLAAFCAWERWCKSGKWSWAATATVSLAALWLTKVYLLVLVLPLLGMLWQVGPAGRQQPGFPGKRLLSAMLLLWLAALPVAAWCVHAMRLAAPGSPWADHIFASLQGNAERYRPPDPLLWNPDFYRRLLDDLTGVILTPLGFCLVLAGFVHRSWRQYALWLAAMIVLVLALPRKFYEMNYYYVATLPPLCIMAGLGWQVIAERLRPGRKATAALLAIGLLIALRYSVRPAFITPEEDRGVVAAGKAIQQLTAAEEPVVTMHGTGIALLYYCNRPGWAVAPATANLPAVLERHRKQGARYLVLAGPDALAPPPAVARHRLVLTGPRYRIYRLLPLDGLAEKVAASGPNHEQ